MWRKVRVGRWKCWILQRRAKRKWFICRERGPAFCFEAPTRPEAIVTAARALKFYKSAVKS